jgi:DNA helicase II / ATP-dependent DNA helicase PcrA
LRYNSYTHLICSLEIAALNYPHFDQEFARLNPQQKQAVCFGTGPVLIVAGAGSGKTRVATMRVAHLIRTGVSASSIVAVTFTNKAAREMRERVHHLVGSEVLVSTFHSLGAKILRESIHALEYPPNFAIYDEAESEKILKDCLKEQGVDVKDKQVREYRNCFSKIKNKPSSRQHFDSLTRSLFDQYQTKLHQSGAVDFDDLLYLPLQIFQQFPEVLNTYTQRWQYLLVDEYQDTCENQSQFASLLAGPSKNIFAVGDPDQSIYSWRGANVDNILSFEDSFENATTIRLDQNYRSTNTILGASNAVIKKNSGRLEKDLWSERGTGELICKHISKTERQEAEYVTDRILEQHAAYDQIAILYRTNAQSRSFEDKLIEEKLPYRIWGGTPFYSRKEVKDILSFLQLASLPQDIAAFDRAIHAIGHGIGDVTLA